eukprot:jgi/Psemu1/42739/gm1.42739_g
MMSALDGPLREEVLMLRKKVVALETAESDNDRLRKDMSKLKLEMLEEKSEVELHFMNQLSEVMRENALKIEEITGRLQESNNVNRALSEQLNFGDPSSKEIEKRFRDLESKHKHEILELENKSIRHLSEVEGMRRELSEVQKSRDELSVKLRESEKSLKNFNTSSGDSVELKRVTEKLKCSQMDHSTAIKEIDNLNREMEELRSELAGALEHGGEKTFGIKKKSAIERETLQNELELPVANMIRSDKMLISRYECENRQLKNTIQLLKDENNRVKYSQDSYKIIKRSDSDSIEKDTIISKLENEIDALQHSIVKIENENRDLKKEMSHENSREQSREFGRSQSFSNVGVEKNGNRTSRIIKQFEQNLKIEGQPKNIINVPIKSQIANGKSNDIELQSLRAELKNLNQELEKERKNSYELRKAVHEFAATTRENRQVYDSDPETAVKSIVETIEKRMQERVDADSISIQRLMGRMEDFPDLVENLEDLKNEMSYQREQIYELEDELANQCEINCNLLKEISSLSAGSEVQRRQNSQMCKASNDANYGEDQKEIDRLMMEVAEVKSQLFTSVEANSRLEDNIKSMTKKHSTEIDRYKAELESAQKIAQNTNSQEEESNMLDLLTKLKEMEMKLVNTEEISHKLKEKNFALEDEKEKFILFLKKEIESSNVIEDYESKIEDLECELSFTKSLLVDHKFQFENEEAALSTGGDNPKYNERQSQCQQNSKASLTDSKLEISEPESALSLTKDVLSDQKIVSSQQRENLNSRLENLQEKLRHSEEVRATLDLDKKHLQVELDRIVEKNETLDEEVKHRHQSLEKLQNNADDKLRKVESTHVNDPLEIKSLRNEVSSLERELSTTRDHLYHLTETVERQKHVEINFKDLSQENIEVLRAQINELQEELTIKRIELLDMQRRYKKEIAQLEETIDSVHLQMSAIVIARDAEIQELHTFSEEKENMSRRLEKEKEQLVFSMQDMMKNRRDEVDDLQNELMEMTTRLANQTQEISTLKTRLEESQYEMSRLRERVAKLSHQLVTQNEREEDDFETSLEMENSELRRRLNEVSAERWMAEDKLQKYISDRGNGGPSRSVQVLRERNAALKFEVEKLTKKLKNVSERISETSNIVELEPYFVGNGVTRMAI